MKNKYWSINSMRCLFVSAGMLYGGAERVTSILVNEWAKRGCETKILVTRTDHFNILR